MDTTKEPPDMPSIDEYCERFAALATIDDPKCFDSHVWALCEELRRSGDERIIPADNPGRVAPFLDLEFGSVRVECWST